ncbi:MAG: hypothetical protein PHE36_01390 [Novosphingobium sp.]|nr:hypothetical protein [Novosphingobium sp.]
MFVLASAPAAIAAGEPDTLPPPVMRVSKAPPRIETAPAGGDQAVAAAIPVSVEIERNGTLVWAGVLRVGSPYGNASFNQSKSDYAEPCQGALSNRTSAQSNERLNFTIRSLRGEPVEQFQISLDLTWRADACDGGTSSVGLRRTVVLKPEGKVREEGEGGVVVTLTRSK